MLALAFVGSLTGAPLSAWLVRRIGQRPTAFAGVAWSGSACCRLPSPAPTRRSPLVALLLILEGVGQGLLAVAYTDIVTGDARRCATAASPAAWRCSRAPWAS